MIELQTVARRWFAPDHTCVVAATGPSLTPEVAETCKGHDTIVVNDAYRMMPWAGVLYACDTAWWKVHNGCPDFAGEKWSSHGPHRGNDKTEVARLYSVRCIAGRSVDEFSTDPSRIHYGSNSGFQAINLAILFGAKGIVLVGFDMRMAGSKRHFFGDHPAGLVNCRNYGQFIPRFERAARKLPTGVTIINATPGSALTCFPMMRLEEALAQP